MKEVPFVWSSEQEKSFQELKKQLASASVLAYFDKDAHTRVIADASPVGLGAVLVQDKNGESRVVCYASRSLSSVERRYSQTEKEALALVWACERFNLYLLGLPTFDLVTDHEALKVIYSRGSKPSARIERWVLRLQPYNYKVCCVKSQDNIADALSRLTKIPASEKYRYDDEHVRMVALSAVPIALKIQEIESASAEDEDLQAVRSCLISGNWETAPKPYVWVRNELTYIGQVILRGTRIVIPNILRKRVLELAHEGHQGVVKMKERLRSKVWWPGVDKDAERKCRECYGCQLVTKATVPPPVKTTRMPERPWQDLALDLLGPMPTGESLLVLVDYFSRWVEVDVIKSTSSEAIIKCLDRQFSRYGVTSTLRSDNGHHAAEKCVQEGDLVLLEKRKENKLSSHYEKEPYQVTARYGDQVQLKSPQGAEYRRNVQHVKRFVIPDREPQEQQPAGPVAVPNEHALGQETTPSLETGGGASPADGPNQEQLLPRRSGRVTRPPERLSDYVTT